MCVERACNLRAGQVCLHATRVPDAATSVENDPPTPSTPKMFQRTDARTQEANHRIKATELRDVRQQIENSSSVLDVIRAEMAGVRAQARQELDPEKDFDLVKSVSFCVVRALGREEWWVSGWEKWDEKAFFPRRVCVF